MSISIGDFYVMMFVCIRYGIIIQNKTIIEKGNNVSFREEEIVGGYI